MNNDLYLNEQNWNDVFDNKNFKNTPGYLKKLFYYSNNKKKLVFENENQDLVYNAIRDHDYILLVGGTGLGKTSVIPIFFYNYLRKEYKPSKGNPKILITEPRRSTVINPFNRMIHDTGMDKYIDEKETEEKEETLISFEELRNLTRETFEDYFKKITNIISDGDDKTNDKNDDNDNDDISKPYFTDKEKELMKIRFISYQVGDTKESQKQTDNGLSWIRFQTDGYFYNLIDDKQLLESIDCLFIDEVHSNSRATLFTMIMLSIYKKNPHIINISKMKIILVTASLLDEEIKIYKTLFPELFELNLPSVSSYPVKKVKIEEKEIVDITTRYISNKENGIIFLSSTQEINKYKEMIYKSSNDKKFFIVPYTKNFDEAFNKKTQQILNALVSFNYTYLVLSTNIGESSITYPNIHYSIDTGKRLDIVYDYKTKITEKLIDYSNQNSFTQKAGRVGRTQAGTFYHTIEKEKLAGYQNILLRENVFEDIITFIDDFADYYEMIKQTMKRMFINFPEDFFDTYERDLLNLNLIKKENNLYKLTETYNNIYLIKKMFIINTSNDKEKTFKEFYPFSKSNFSHLSLIYYHPKREILELILLINKNKINSIAKSKGFKNYNNKYLSKTGSEPINLINYINNNDIQERFMTKRDSKSLESTISKYETNEIELTKALLYSLYFNRTKNGKYTCEYLPTNISIDINYLHCDLRLENFV